MHLCTCVRVEGGDGEATTTVARAKNLFSRVFFPKKKSVPSFFWKSFRRSSVCSKISLQPSELKLSLQLL
jgi:hypothetical protein